MGELLSATVFGKKRANLSASLNNALKLATTVEGTTTNKDYMKAVASGKKLVSAVVNGVTITFVDTILVQNPRDVEDALYAVLAPLEVGVFIRAQYVSGKLYIKYISSAENLGTITLETAGEMSTASNSTVKNHSRGMFHYVGSDELIYDGNAAMVLANDPYLFTGDESTDNATADTLKADLITAFNSDSLIHSDLTVEPDASVEKFKVTFRCATSDIAKLTCEGNAISSLRSWDTYDALDAEFYCFD